MYNYILKSYTY